MLDEVAAAAAELPSELIAQVAVRLEKLGREGTPAPWGAALDDLPPGGARARFEILFDRWTVGGGSAADLAWALRGADAADRMQRDGLGLELVWTGPAPAGCSLRRTDQALLQLIRDARRHLLVVTFAAYKVPEVRVALDEAVGRGVDVDLVLEYRDASGGKVTFDAADALGGVSPGARLWAWPIDERTRDAQGRYGTLHAKCAVADGDALLISSANLTEYALALNMELGLLVRGGDLPARVARHFSELMAHGVLRRA